MASQDKLETSTYCEPSRFERVKVEALAFQNGSNLLSYKKERSLGHKGKDQIRKNKAGQSQGGQEQG